MANNGLREFRSVALEARRYFRNFADISEAVGLEFSGRRYSRGRPCRNAICLRNGLTAPKIECIGTVRRKTHCAISTDEPSTRARKFAPSHAYILHLRGNTVTGLSVLTREGEYRFILINRLDNVWLPFGNGINYR